MRNNKFFRKLSKQMFNKKLRSLNSRKTQEKFSTAAHIYNHGPNILEPRNISVQVRFSTSKTKHDM